jgi:hypothetical protein
MNEPSEADILDVLRLATKVAAAGRIMGKTAIRRVCGTAEWRHDEERVAAAEAKRERRRARNRRNT